MPSQLTTDPVKSSAAAAPSMPPLLDRDLSILAFNERVLDWARRKNVPLLERLRYLCIVSSNLDEFFEVRAAPHVEAAQGAQGASDLSGLERIAHHARAMVNKQVLADLSARVNINPRAGMSLLGNIARDYKIAVVIRFSSTLIHFVRNIMHSERNHTRVSCEFSHRQIARVRVHTFSTARLAARKFKQQ